MIPKTLRWTGQTKGRLDLIDQRKLPGSLEILRCRNIEQVWDAIKNLAVRGAPAIGVTAAYGVCLAMQGLDESCQLDKALSRVRQSCDFLATSRPTAVNLFWALRRISDRAENFAASNKNASVSELRRRILAEARMIHQEDIEMCRAIGRNGKKFIKDNFGILTHCNAGALATSGEGTALAPMFEAHRDGCSFCVYVDETRPLLQGARLTAWELGEAGIDTTLICDNMAASLMKEGKINAVITGADRIAANGDTANKIGTLALSILAGYYSIPFYIAAPSSTFDLSLENGGQIPIEQRCEDEITTIGRIKVAPEGVKVYNPAFDVTDACNITAIITEKGIIEKPNTDRITGHLAQ
ncbi:MAG: S-methyl-5-thioribose-1-phosphate isomerase [Planctomycetota bacterium]